jgi:hypothetical protein
MLLHHRAHSIIRPGSLALLAPATGLVPKAFRRVDIDATRHADLLGGLQSVRGGAYLRDGAIAADQLTREGRHVQDADAVSWHVVSLQDGKVTACARLRPHHPDCAPSSLGVWSSALARSAAWSDKLWRALDADLALARMRNVQYVEAGGWAVGDEWRRTTMTLTTAIATFALGECVGGFVGLTTATVRHCSARMMRKLGGHSFTAEGGASVPSYFDAHYGCEMELLRFDSKRPAAHYAPLVDQVVRALHDVPVICAAVQAHEASESRGLLRSLVTRAERRVPCLGAGGFVPA